MVVACAWGDAPCVVGAARTHGARPSPHSSSGHSPHRFPQPSPHHIPPSQLDQRLALLYLPDPSHFTAYLTATSHPHPPPTRAVGSTAGATLPSQTPPPWAPPSIRGGLTLQSSALWGRPMRSQTAGWVKGWGGCRGGRGARACLVWVDHSTLVAGWVGLLAGARGLWARWCSTLLASRPTDPPPPCRSLWRRCQLSFISLTPSLS